MARILLTCWGSFGDLFPSLGMATALKARGHVAVIGTCGYYRGIVEGEGFEFRAVRPDVDPEAGDLIRRIMDPARGTEVILREILVPAVRDAYTDLSAAARDVDLIVSHPVTFAAPLVAGVMRLPWISTALAPISFFSLTDFPVLPNAPGVMQFARSLGPWVTRALMGFARRVTGPWLAPVRVFRAELGLPSCGDPLYEGQFSPYGTLALFSRTLAAPQPDWPVKTTITGFPFFNRAIPMPPDLERFLDAGDPPIVFTLGTSAVGAAGDFYEESVRAVNALGRRAVLLVGRNPENRPRSPMSDRILLVEAAPHDALFPRAAAIVHQAGIGTTGQALRAAKPTLIVPHAHDQPDNAFRVTKLGCARVIYPRAYRAGRVAGELQRLLDGENYRDAAHQAAKLVATEAGTATAADVILQLVNEACSPR